MLVPPSAPLLSGESRGYDVVEESGCWSPVVGSRLPVAISPVYEICLARVSTSFRWNGDYTVLVKNTEANCKVYFQRRWRDMFPAVFAGVENQVLQFPLLRALCFCVVLLGLNVLIVEWRVNTHRYAKNVECYINPDLQRQKSGYKYVFKSVRRNPHRESRNLQMFHCVISLSCAYYTGPRR